MSQANVSANVEAEPGNFLSEEGITLRLSGIIDELAVPTLETVILYYLDNACRSFVFDFKNLVYLHSTGISLMKSCADIASKRKGQAVVVNANRQISNLFVYLDLGFLLYRQGQSIVTLAPSTSAQTSSASPVHYWVLGLEPGATQQEIQDAYRYLAGFWHVALFPPGSTQWTRANKKMEEIDRAYLALTTLKPELASG